MSIEKSRTHRGGMYAVGLIYNVPFLEDITTHKSFIRATNQFECGRYVKRRKTYLQVKLSSFLSFFGFESVQNFCLATREEARTVPMLRLNFFWIYIDGSCSVDCINCSLVIKVSRQRQSDGCK